MTSPVCDSPGFSEAVLSVSDLAYWTEFLSTVFQWEIVHSGQPDPHVKTLWNLADTAEITEVLFRDPVAETAQGGIRLVNYEGETQEYARPASYAWDGGGFFDLHVQVNDVQALYEDMLKMGWQGFTEPKRLDVSGVVIDEVLVRGPDGIAFALIERISPPFQVVEDYQRVSPAWNAPQMVSNFTLAHQFYAEGLGFKATIEAEMPPAPDGDNLFGLPLNVARNTTTQLAFFHPSGQRGAMGSVDILHLAGIEGRDLSDTTKPPNLGLVLIRFPTKNVRAYAEAVTTAGAEVWGDITALNIEPFGPCLAFSVRSPEGAILEFYEVNGS